jgi:hypothetical protein
MSVNDRPFLQVWQLPEVQITFYVGFSIFLIWGVFLVDDFRECLHIWSIKGANNLMFEVLKAPLYVLGGTTALIVLLGMNHRSAQTAQSMSLTMHAMDLTAQSVELTTKSMSLTKEQNVFTNYYAHLKEFREYWERKCPEKISDGVSQDANAVYRTLFAEAKAGNVNIAGEFIGQVIDALDPLIIRSNELLRCKTETSDELIRDYSDLVESIAVELGVKLGVMNTRFPKNVEWKPIRPEHRVSVEIARNSHHILWVEAGVQTLRLAMEFDPHFKDQDLSSSLIRWHVTFHKLQTNVKKGGTDSHESQG